MCIAGYIYKIYKHICYIYKYIRTNSGMILYSLMILNGDILFHTLRSSAKNVSCIDQWVSWLSKTCPRMSKAKNVMKSINQCHAVQISSKSSFFGSFPHFRTTDAERCRRVFPPRQRWGIERWCSAGRTFSAQMDGKRWNPMEQQDIIAGVAESSRKYSCFLRSSH